MTTASEIITLAYREANFNAVGSTPTADELSEGLTLLKSLSDSLFPLVVGTKLQGWYVPWPQKNAARAANYPAAPGDAGILPPNGLETPPANVRLMMKNTTAKTIFFQYQPEDGALMEYVDVGHTANVVLDANGALFGLTGGDTQVTITSDFPTNRNARRRWIYRADVGAWVEVTTLELTTEMPYPTWFDDWFITALAMRLSPRFGNEPRSMTLMRYKDMTVLIRGLYQQMGIAIIGSPGGHLTDQSYEGYATGFDSGDFDSGFA